MLILLLFSAIIVGQQPKHKEVVMKITSSAFSDGALIPIKYTCDGDDISRPLCGVTSLKIQPVLCLSMMTLTHR